MRAAPVAILLSMALFAAGSRAAAHEEPGVGSGDPGSTSAASPIYGQVCDQGFAAGYPCSQVDLLAFLPHSSLSGGQGNSMWGWVDRRTGQEYALLGESSAAAFVDITTPFAPVYVGKLPTQTVNSIWRDLKVFGDYAFIVSEAPDHGMQVLDLRQLRDVTTPPVTLTPSAHYAGFGNAHTLAVNEDSGYAYAVGTNTCSGGLHMIDVRNPLAPTFAGCYGGDGYVHETQCVTYSGPDAEHVGQEVCFCSDADTLTIVDVSDKAKPLQLSRSGYAGYGYTHQSWTTDDHRYLLLDDETDEVNHSHNTRTYVFDIADLEQPRLVGTFTAATAAIDHNQYIRGEFVFQANYRAGLRVLHLTDLSQARLTEVAFFDIYPADDDRGYNGAWAVFPFFPSGNVIVNGIEQGLFVLGPHLNTPGPSATPTATRTRTSTRTPTPTYSPVPTASATATRTGTRTATPRSTATPSPTVSPTITATPSPAPAGLIAGQIAVLNGEPGVGFPITILGSNERTVVTDESGGFTFTDLPLGDWTLAPGATEAPATIDAADAARILAANVGQVTLSPEERLGCDASGNGTLSGLDASLVLKRAVGLLEALPIEEHCRSPWLFVPQAGPADNQSVTLPSAAGGVCTAGAIHFSPLGGEARQQSFRAVRLGDCNQSEAAPRRSAPGAKAGLVTTLSIGPTERVRSGRRRISLLNRDPSGPRAFRRTFFYDPDRFRFIRVRRMSASEIVFEINARTPGILRIAGASPHPIPVNRIVLGIELAAR